ncbi:MAG: LPS export ABC transporter periplasmic protein LptC [Flavobacteriales bacterium]
MEISIQNDLVYPVETIIDCEVIYSDSANIRVLLNAKEMNRYSSDTNYIEFKNGLKVQFFDDHGKKESELSSDYAIIDEENNIMKAQHNVIVRNIDGNILESETLSWDQENEKIYTNDFVKITTKKEVILGHGFESNQYFSKYSIKKIKGTIVLSN